MFICYINDAWKLCCLYVVLGLIIYFNEIDILAQRILVINNSLFQSITGDIAPTLFFLKHTLEARSRCVVLLDILVGSRSHIDHCRQPISSNLLSGCIDAVAVNYGGFACPCAEVASSVVYISNLIGSFTSGLRQLFLSSLVIGSYSGFLEKVESNWWIQSPASD